MHQALYVLVVIAAIGGYWWWTQRKMKAQGGVAGMLAAADKQAFGLSEGESLAKRWDAMFYIGKLVPETMPSMGEAVMNALTNTFVRGRHVRMGLTTTNRIVFSMEPDQHDAPGTFATLNDQSKAWSKGFLPAMTITPATAPRITMGEQLFGAHPAWAATQRDAPSAKIDPQNWAAAQRKMVIARLENLPNGRTWNVWIDPEAAQFLSSWASPAGQRATA